MIQIRKVAAGKYYIDSNRNIAREVLEVKDDAVFFITYHLDTGASTGNPNMCMKTSFTHWAHHEATQAEIFDLQHRRM